MVRICGYILSLFVFAGCAGDLAIERVSKATEGDSRDFPIPPESTEDRTFIPEEEPNSDENTEEENQTPKDDTELPSDSEPDSPDNDGGSVPDGEDQAGDNGDQPNNNDQPSDGDNPDIDPSTPGGDTPDNPANDPKPKDDDVCDPFSSGGHSQGVENGLIGKLAYLSPSLVSAGEKINFAEDYWTLSNENEFVANAPDVIATEARVFSPNLNVPTRRFEEGFVPEGEGSEALKTTTGETLTEYFSLYYQSELVLADAEPGRYEIAVLSDDGSVLYLANAFPDALETDFVLDNDGNHPTKMRCQPLGSDAIEMTAESRLPLELFYHQGPRFHISLIMMWRKLDDGELPGQDPLCGVSGNSAWFDFETSPSTPKQNYNDLLDRGWEVIPSQNFILPHGVDNPCVD